MDAIRVLNPQAWTLNFNLQRATALCDQTQGDETQIIARCRAGERAAFEQLLHRYRERVINLAFGLLGSRDDAEDAAQETFIRAFSSLHQFRGDAQFWTWLYRITVNTCHARARRVSPENIEDTLLDSSPDARCQAETALEVQQALGRLSPVLREVLVLREMHGLSYDEISLVLSIPLGTVRSRLNEARAKFRQVWQEDET